VTTAYYQSQILLAWVLYNYVLLCFCSGGSSVGSFNLFFHCDNILFGFIKKNMRSLKLLVVQINYMYGVYFFRTISLCALPRKFWWFWKISLKIFSKSHIFKQILPNDEFYRTIVILQDNSNYQIVQETHVIRQLITTTMYKKCICWIVLHQA
jgi:hypothetical protein